LLTFSIFFKCLKNIDLLVLATAEVRLVVESGPAAPSRQARLSRYLGREDVCVSPSDLRAVLPAADVHVWRMSLDCCVERDRASFGLS
jgi:hypothetical protein